MTGWYLTQLALNGMKVQDPGDQLRTDLEKIGEVMAGEWVEKVGPDGKAIVDKFKASK